MLLEPLLETRGKEMLVAERFLSYFCVESRIHKSKLGYLAEDISKQILKVEIHLEESML